ncbi:MAG TPA: S8 family serine peptidase, partial [bacterium]|nr:S8 family serine peptidase [bacterium]
MRAVIPWLPEYKIDPALIENTDEQVVAKVFLWDESGLETVENLIINNGGTILRRYLPEWKRLLIRIGKINLIGIAQSEQVENIQKLTEEAPFFNMNVAMSRIKEDSDFLEPPYSWNIEGLNGKDEIIAIIDSGFGNSGEPDVTSPEYFHPDFRGDEVEFPNGRVVGMPDVTGDGNVGYTTTGHGTNVAGIVLGDGKSSEYLQGVAGELRSFAPKSYLLFIDRIKDGDTSYNCLEDVYNELDTFQFNNDYSYIHNHSYGSNENWGEYTDRSRDIDGFLSDSEEPNHFNYLDVFAVGDWSWMSPSTQSVSKNAVSVASIRADMITQGYSNTGPTKDFRIKPDVSALELEFHGTVTTSDGFDSGNYYESFSMTSGAAPQATGILSLIREYFRTHNSVNTAWLSDSVNRRPTSALLKAALINGAMRPPGNHNFGIHGWGWPNLRNSTFMSAVDNDYAAFYFEDTIDDN